MGLWFLICCPIDNDNYAQIWFPPIALSSVGCRRRSSITKWAGLKHIPRTVSLRITRRTFPTAVSDITSLVASGRLQNALYLAHKMRCCIKPWPNYSTLGRLGPFCAHLCSSPLYFTADRKQLLISYPVSL